MEEFFKNFKKKGWEVQKELAPPMREFLSKEEIMAKKPKISAVLCLLYQKNSQWHLPLILRSTYKGVHPNQISLPGGKFEKKDQNLETTAKRETSEEIGVTLPENQELIPLTELYVPPSNFLIYPFVTYLNEELQFKKEEKEVAEIVEISLQELQNTQIQSTLINQMNVPCFEIQNHIIWGATAMILNELLNSLHLQTIV